MFSVYKEKIEKNDCGQHSEDEVGFGKITICVVYVMLEIIA